MIAHHKGAVDMVEDLTDRGGTAADPILYQFVNDVSNEQTAEIDKMDTLRASFVGDPRVDLKPGYTDAGQAILNMEKIASLPRPAGFFDPANPSGLPPAKAQKALKKGGAPRPGNAAAKDVEWFDRSPLLSFAQTDMAFEGDRLFVGNYHGFNIYRLGDNGVPVAGQLGGLPRRPGRRFGGRQSAADVGRAGPRAARLRASGQCRGHQPRPLPRAAHLRHFRHHATAPGRPGPDLPRIAHP